MKEVGPGDSVNSLLSILDVITVSGQFGAAPVSAMSRCCWWGSSEDSAADLDSPRAPAPPGSPAPPAHGVCPCRPRLHGAAAAGGGLLCRVHQVPGEPGAGGAGQWPPASSPQAPAGRDLGPSSCALRPEQPDPCAADSPISCLTHLPRLLLLLVGSSLAPLALLSPQCSQPWFAPPSPVPMCGPTP